MENNSLIPQHLYHYTSIDALKEIVKNKTIRFKRFDLLNDPYEGFVTVQTANRVTEIMTDFMYCSCWSPNDEESVAMWVIYAELMGARIKLKYDMFLDRQSVGTQLFLKDYGDKVYPVTAIRGMMIGKDNGLINQIYGPIKVLYGNLNSLNSNVAKKHYYNKGKESELVVNDIYIIEKGVRKINHWQYENEYRYFISHSIELHANDKVIEELPERVSITADYPEYIDIKLHREIEEVVLGPEISEDKEKEIRDFLGNYGIKNVIKSKVKYNRKAR